MKNESKDLKIHILILCCAVLYIILTALNHVPLFIAGIKYMDSNNMKIYTIAYQIFAISSALLFFFSYKNIEYEKLISNVKKYILGISSIFVYFLLSELQLLPFQLLDIDVSKIPLYLKVIYLLCYEAILIGIIFLINIKRFKNDINDIKINHKSYYKNCLKYWLIALFIMYSSNLIISLLGSSLPNNEEIIREQFSISPLYIFISAVIFAPIVEESIFRLSFRNIFNNKWLFIIISGLVFGGMHVFNGSDLSLIDILYIIPYSVPGMAFAYMLYKTDNILVSMGFHALHNGIMISLQFFMMYFL